MDSENGYKLGGFADLNNIRSFAIMVSDMCIEGQGNSEAHGQPTTKKEEVIITEVVVVLEVYKVVISAVLGQMSSSCQHQPEVI